MDEIKGRVGIPNSYFLKMAKHDYEDYQKALPREFYQNSIDAGASRIDVSFGDDRSITISDDGCGMTLETLRDKLLVLGGSLKGEGATGAFGKAKEVLFFSWDRYFIHTNEWEVSGVGAEYIISKSPNPVKGTVCKIWLPDSEPLYIRNEFAVVASRMQTKCKIFVDGELVEQKARGNKVREIEGIADIHQIKSKKNSYMLVRINGIWMFNQYIGDQMGEIVIELKGNSLDLLTSNRDGFKWDIRNKMSKFLEELIIDKSGALKSEVKMVKSRIKGTGEITVGEEQLEIARNKIQSGHNLAAVIEQVFGEMAKMSPIQKHRVVDASKKLGLEWEEYCSYIKFIGYEPDFVLSHREEKIDSVNKFMATKKARVLATMWTEIIKQVLMDNKRYLSFTAGFTFDNEVEASIESVDGNITIYLNPHKISISSDRRIIVEELKDLAIHEIAHLRNRYHDENFVLEMAAIRRATYADPKPYINIQRTR